MCSTRQAYGIAIDSLASQSPRIIALDGDVKNSTYLELLEQVLVT